ncbi:DNA alkylation repair protein [Candidatus Roizmanbacteria bacterium]|nr:DNA alkylation repair protein [Candidatus Roizmanbacteria bacterium]
MLQQLQKDLRKLASPEKAKIMQRFFKTGKGEYGEGDIFLGITVPEQRKLAIRFKKLDIEDLQKLLGSKIHEERLVSLMILRIKYQKTDQKGKKEIFDFYLNNTRNINNWDLIDLSSGEIVGNYLRDKDKSILYKLARSENLWEKRIAMLATYPYIKKGEFAEAFKIAEILLRDKHDLIQKAVGWMLREIGKRDQKVEEEFLRKYYKIMPRTMLRYAIEKFPGDKRKFYLTK